MPNSGKKNINEIMNNLGSKIRRKDEGIIIPFNEYLLKSGEHPQLMFRNVFQLFSSMIHFYIKEEDEYGKDPENINYKTINCDKLLVDDADTPFFSDLPLANRLLRLADSFKTGAQQNKIYIFIGPPGSGKSTFLNNLLWKFQEFTTLPEGILYEVLWQLDESKFGKVDSEIIQAALEEYYKKYNVNLESSSIKLGVPCPNHDHPILMIPKEHRKEIIGSILTPEMKVVIFNKKEYEWIFKDSPCTICKSIFQNIIERIKSPEHVFDMLYAKRYYFNRRVGNGITVYNPGDHEPVKLIYSNEIIQKKLGELFKDSNSVNYVYSRYAKTNNGVFAIMDVKGDNEKRFLDLHGVISEGVHRIEEIEESVNSLFIAVMNPEDKEKIKLHESFKDRIKEINVNYNLNYYEESKIYYHSFGKQIQKRFLPKVLSNFAKIIISSRLNPNSEALKEWIKDPKKYNQYCDDNLLLLKLSIYNNKIPKWLTQDDYNIFNKNIRRKLIDESELEGRRGFSGRESVTIFNEFYNSLRLKNATEGNGKNKLLITMDEIKEFFNKNKNYFDRVPKGFIDSIIRLYDYDIIQQIKESLFHQNEERISKDIQNYLFASNYDQGERQVAPYTNETLEISDTFFNIVEQHLFKKDVSIKDRKRFREEIAARFVISLQEMQSDNQNISETTLYKDLYSSYMKNLRENIFQPFLQYTAFENAIKEFGTEKFEVYDQRTKEEVKFLIKNLMSKHKYSQDGACQVCLYVLHNRIAEKFLS